MCEKCVTTQFWHRGKLLFETNAPELFLPFPPGFEVEVITVPYRVLN